ncbi:MAG: hydrogenase small subunit [Actinomycetes bacterium]|jgi:hydrogenase small subunit|nr:hydrogenase small subunit [Actinomycetes bacterium]
MAESQGAFYERLAGRGVSRRDFLKFCGSVAALLGLSQTWAATIATKVAEAAESGLYPALWLNGGGCTGCSESIAQSADPSVAEIVLDILSLNYIETLMMAMGADADEAIISTAEEHEGNFILLYEGAIMEGWDGNALRIAGKPSVEQVKEVAAKAAACISVGSCAVDGGLVRSYPNPSKATGLAPFLQKEGISTPVINLPGCPANPEHIVAIVVDALILGTLENGKILDKLDEFGRPKYLFGQTIHDNCPRRGHFENGEFVYEFGTEEEAKGYCLYPVGCKGPQTQTTCPVTRWNGQTSWCVEAGAPCIGCAQYNWVDNSTPFLGRVRPVGRGKLGGPSGVDPAWAAAAVGGVVAVGLVAHGFGMKAAGRIGKNAKLENEPMKEYDAKRQKKGVSVAKGGE